jgi:hypothetical protein
MHEKSKSTQEKIEELFVAIWCVVMPVTGTLLVPSIQGTVPAYMMAFCSVLFVLLRLQRGEIPPAVAGYAKSALNILLIWLFLLVASQVGLMMSDRHDFSGAEMIEGDDNSIVFRTSLFTQSIYLAACALIALYFRYFFKESWMRYVFYGGYFLAGYGIYEWIYYLVFHQSGDFLANRTFGEVEHPASWSQSINFGGLTLLRIKSTLGEPAFFTGAVLPFLFIALDYRKVALSVLLIFVALFSTSTSCYLGLILCLFIKSIWSGRIKASYFFILCLVAAFLIGMALLFPDTFYAAFSQKLSGDNLSGKTRLNGMTITRDLLGTFTIPNWLFGLGFGYVYNSVFLAILENTGIIGLIVFVSILFRPILFLPIKPESEGLKLGLVAIALLFSMTLSEIFLPTTWMFLGLAYGKLDSIRQSQRRLSTLHSMPTRTNLFATSR